MPTSRLDLEVTDNGSAGVVQKKLSAIGKEAATAGYSVRSLDHLLGVLGASFVVEKFARFADEWQNIHNKLLNVTDGAKNLNAVNEALFQGAQKSRTAYGEFVNVYQELAIQAARFGTSQKQMVDITTTMMQAAQLAHPSLAAMKMGVEQLILSMERGRLQTRGFSALLKDTPQLAKAMAEGLGVSINQLRELAHHSKLTSSEMIAALEKVGPKVQQDFLKLQPTIEGAMTVLHNGWVKFIGDLDQSTGVIGGVTGLIIDLANHMDILAGGLVVFGALATAVFGGLARKAILSMWAALVASGPVGWAIAAITALIGLLAIFGDKVSVTKDGTVSLLDYIKGFFATLGDLWNTVSQFFTGANDNQNAFVSGALDVFSHWLDVIKTVVNFAIGMFVVMKDQVVFAFTTLPGILRSIFDGVLTYLSAKFADFINSISAGINAISSFAGMGTIGKVTGITFGDGGKTALGTLGAGAALNNQMAQDVGFNYLGALNDHIMGHARQISAARRGASGGGLLTEHGPPAPDDANAKKHHGNPPKTRAQLIAEETRKYADEAATTNDVGNTYLNRTAFNEVTKFNDDLQKHRDKKGHFFAPLSPEEKASLMATVQGLEDAKRLQEARDKVMKEAIGPRVEYMDQEKAIAQLLERGKITAEEAAKAERAAAIAFLDKQTDEASGKMLGQLKILDSMNDRAKPLASAMETIWKDQMTGMTTYMTQLEAIDALLQAQLLTAEKAQDAIRKAQITYLDSETDAMSGITVALMKIRDEADNAAQHMGKVVTDAFSGLEDAFVKLSTGQKFDAKSALRTVQEDLAKAFFAPIKEQLAGVLQDKFGVKIPGLEAKLGTTPSNPMWVKNADAITGAGSLFGQAPAINQGNIFGLDLSNGSGEFTPLNGDTSKWDTSFHGLNTGLKDVFDKSTINLGQTISAGVAMLSSSIGGLLGGKGGSFIGTVLGDVAMVASAYFGKKFATGGDFVVGGSGGVDSQPVSFMASPGERVSIARPGESAGSGGSGGNFYHLEIDARGTNADEVEHRVDMAMARAMPLARKVAKEDAIKEMAMRSRRQKLAGAR